MPCDIATKQRGLKQTNTLSLVSSRSSKKQDDLFSQVKKLVNITTSLTQQIRHADFKKQLNASRYHRDDRLGMLANCSWP